MYISRTKEQQKEYIKEHSTITETGCWEWNNHTTKYGYGQVKWLGKGYPTHRLSYILWYGDIPEGMVVRHKCDNPPCCNPDHIEIGSVQDNHNDMVSRGRSMIGTRNNKSKLTDDDVRVIRDIYDKHIKGRRDTRTNKTYSIKMLSEQYNVSQPTIERVCSRRSWKHIS